MSNALAIAAVTAVMRDLLQDGLIDHDATAGLGDVTVSVLSPERALDTLTSDASASLINLFLYQVTLNQGWRNVNQPERDSLGRRVTNPPLALDLHYLLTIYSNQDFHAEILLGYAMQLLHETPVLSRDAIRVALAPVSPVLGDVLPAPSNLLSAADLAEQVEQIKITPQPLTMEEMSHIWSNLQSRYRPTMAYHASVVLIESRQSVQSTLPVRDLKIYVRTLRRPRIERVGAQATPTTPLSLTQPILPGYQLVLLGRQLRGDDVLVRVGDVEVTVPLASVNDDRIGVLLPAGLRAGVQAAQVVHRVLMGEPATPHRSVESNVAPFVLHPVFSAAPTFLAAAGGLPPRVRVAVDPPVGKKQRVALLLDELQPTPPPDVPPARSYSFTLPPRAGDPADNDATLDIAVTGAVPGVYLVRVQIDGAESLLQTDTSGRYIDPTVVIP